MTQEEHYGLVALSWRYAVLIGITSPDGIFSDEIVQADLKRWGHLVKTNMGGRPVFDDADAIGFMVTESGRSIEDCERVLADEWALSEDEIADSI
ncbi:MAG TPA: hypothetical protein VKU01_05535 [Bryobacteraceae bacterium]|nr:hypothetical protein [Bryobacteraceae bacterium]